MRHIDKAPSPELFEAWKSQENPDWSPSYADLRHPEKQVLRNSLLEEQGFTCCYCGRRIEERECHIEHFRPQSQFPERALDYGNLHLSCGPEENGKFSQKTCGYAKEGQFEEGFISPCEPGVEQRFCYDRDGYVFPAKQEDTYAKKMIQVLRLGEKTNKDEKDANIDEKKLVLDRKNAISIVADDIADLSDDDLRILLSTYRKKENGKYKPFFHAIARFIEQYLPAANSQHANPPCLPA
jgi:uncharacterized protein (TIGR02646 family)